MLALTAIKLRENILLIGLIRFVVPPSGGQLKGHENPKDRLKNVAPVHKPGEERN
jgi:hypothetical protein